MILKNINLSNKSKKISHFFLWTKFKLIFLGLFLLTFCHLKVVAQITQETKNGAMLTDYYQEGEQLLLEQNYKKALKLFERALDINETFVPALRGAGICHEALNDYYKASDYYKKVIFLNPRFSRALYYEYANVLYKTGFQTKAVEYFEKYERLQAAPISDFGFNGTKELSSETQYLKKLPGNIVACHISMDSVKYLSIKMVENLGDGINTKGDEYFPFLSNDQKSIYYTYRKEEKSDENLHISQFQNEKWRVGKPVSSFNSKEHEGMSTFVRDGRTMYFTACNRENVLGTCDIWEASIKGKKISDIKTLKGYSNSEDWDSQACISCDGSKLYFASNRPGGFGGTDIWLSERQTDGSWSFPVNLGPNVNTIEDEEAPFITNDGHTLYFSSTGHLGLGEQDIFMCHMDEKQEWSVAFNLGPPVNSPLRELGFFLSADGKTGYFASNRVEGYGGMDIYKFELSDHLYTKPITYVEGVVRDSVYNLPVACTIYPSNRPPIETDKLGRFFLCLPADEPFRIKINEEDFAPYERNHNIPKWDNKKFYELKIPLQPLHFLATKAAPITKKTEIKVPKMKPPKAVERDTQEVLVVKKEPEMDLPSRLNHTLYYEFDQADLNADLQQKLDEFLSSINRLDITRVEVIGYADYLGEATYNLILSKKRAKSVALFLTNKGIAVDDLLIEGRGEVKNDKPLRENRRVDVVITVKGKEIK